MVEVDKIMGFGTTVQAKRLTVIMLDQVREFGQYSDEAAIVHFIDGSHIFVAQSVSSLKARIEHATIKSLAAV